MTPAVLSGSGELDQALPHPVSGLDCCLDSEPCPASDNREARAQHVQPLRPIRKSVPVDAPAFDEGGPGPAVRPPTGGRAQRPAQESTGARRFPVATVG